jgi:hypothetical protein
MRRSDKVINLARQEQRLRQLFPRSKSRVRSSKLTWESDLTPTPVSDKYHVRLSYSLEAPPLIRVIDPELELPGGKSPPHLYKGGSLCLYLPGAGEWRRSLYLGDVVIPWVAEWLANYEVWLATGEWYGGGVQPVDQLSASSPAGTRLLRSRFARR